MAIKFVDMDKEEPTPRRQAAAPAPAPEAPADKGAEEPRLPFAKPIKPERKKKG